jgi:hypothetical protein
LRSWPAAPFAAECYRFFGSTLPSTDFDLEPNMFVYLSFATFVSTLTKLTAAETSSHLVGILIFGLNVVFAMGSIAFMMGTGIPKTIWMSWHFHLQDTAFVGT